MRFLEVWKNPILPIGIWVIVRLLQFRLASGSFTKLLAAWGMSSCMHSHLIFTPSMMVMFQQELHFVSTLLQYNQCSILHGASSSPRSKNVLEEERRKMCISPIYNCRWRRLNGGAGISGTPVLTTSHEPHATSHASNVI